MHISNAGLLFFDLVTTQELRINNHCKGQQITSFALLQPQNIWNPLKNDYIFLFGLENGNFIVCNKQGILFQKSLYESRVDKILTIINTNNLFLTVSLEDMHIRMWRLKFIYNEDEENQDIYQGPLQIALIKQLKEIQYTQVYAVRIPDSNSENKNKTPKKGQASPSVKKNPILDISQNQQSLENIILAKDTCDEIVIAYDNFARTTVFICKLMLERDNITDDLAIEDKHYVISYRSTKQQDDVKIKRLIKCCNEYLIVQNKEYIRIIEIGEKTQQYSKLLIAKIAKQFGINSVEQIKDIFITQLSRDSFAYLFMICFQIKGKTPIMGYFDPINELYFNPIAIDN
ncbi:UNKNOWN [Stylonychia lemnae]|uniref:Uncharacterized protein n=1 Tax=Stylonychia lemnae TaxID=5949 RepID=A0A078AP08_STYLE|nr:UNKNOWN [Stylonychia lemnae]|eukprot:CDW83666.1 UNKNOWN [Stylonychia lemnae]